MTPLEIMILGPAALACAQRLQQIAPGSRIHAPRQRRFETDASALYWYQDFGQQLRALQRGSTPVVALCAAGIIIRALAPNLVADDKLEGAPILAIAPDGSSVVPLLGGLRGVNRLATQLATALDCQAAITTSGEVRFGTCLLDPPAGYVLADIEQGKHIVAHLLSGQTVQIEGQAPWLETIDLPRADPADCRIKISNRRQPATANELRLIPRNLAIAIADPSQLSVEACIAQLQTDLRSYDLADAALAVIVAPADSREQARLSALAAQLKLPLRLLSGAAAQSWSQQLQQALPDAELKPLGPTISLLVARQPIDPSRLGQPRGRLSVIGLGPGAKAMMIPAAQQALAAATDILGYATYVEMAGPLRADQQIHPSDNREELQRAAHGLQLAASGRHVAMVSSGDPGIFAMAAAVLEALDQSQDPRWHELELEILPGVTAAMATAAVAGAPLGHDFCMLSLSDNLKPWAVIERRIQLAAEADLAMAFYNPISKHRPWQLDRALELLRQYRDADTPVVLGRDIARPRASLRTLRLAEVRSEMVDMRTMLLIGASTTRWIKQATGRDWVYTPRSYPANTISRQRGE